MIGFDINFLENCRFTIELPKLNDTLIDEALNNGDIFEFNHFSLVMNKKLRSAIYVASNIDKSKMKEIKRGDFWHFDERIGAENQMGNEFYKNNEWDRGHLARRKDLCWGSMEEAKKSNYDSFCWANISLQHAKFNQGIWNELEEWILEDLPNDILYKKLSVLTGPINDKNGMEYCGVGNPLGCGVIIPIGFWKTIIYVDKENNLKSSSFIMKQKEYLYRSLVKDLDLLEPYQVSLETVSEVTNLIFQDNLYIADNYKSHMYEVEKFELRDSIRGKLIKNKNDLISTNNA